MPCPREFLAQRELGRLPDDVPDQVEQVEVERAAVVLQELTRELGAARGADVRAHVLLEEAPAPASVETPTQAGRRVFRETDRLKQARIGESPRRAGGR